MIGDHHHIMRPCMCQRSRFCGALRLRLPLFSSSNPNMDTSTLIDPFILGVM